MNCQQYRREIDETDFGAAAPGAAAAHAGLCDACRKFADERARLRALVSELEPVGAPPDFEFRLRARLASERSGPGGWLPLRFAPGAAAVALAACFALAVGFVVLRRQASDAPAPQSAATREGIEASKAGQQDKAVASTSNAPPLVGSSDERATELANAGAQTKTDGLRNVPHRRRDARRLTGDDASRASLASRTERRPATSEASARASRASADALQTHESAFAAAQSFTVGEPIPLPINPSAQSLKVVLRDESGAARVVAVKPVSFGAEELAGQLGGPRRATPRPPREGVW